MRNIIRILLALIITILFTSKAYSQTLEQLNNIIEEYYNQGNYEKAIEYGEKAIVQAEKEFGKKHENYASSLNDLGILYMTTGNYTKAEPLYQESLEIRKEILGENHPDYASSLNNLAVLYKATGYYIKAEKLYKEAIKIQQVTPGINHPDYAISLGNLATLYLSTGNYAEAEHLYKEEMKILKVAYGENHPDYAISLNNLAELYRMIGEYKKAEPLYQEALKINKEVFGENNIDYATFLNNLAALYYQIGNYKKAEPLYIKTIEIYKEVLGENHFYCAWPLNDLAELYQSMGDYTKSETLYQETTKIYKETLGENHPDYAIFLNNLAGLYESIGDYTKSEPLYQEAMKIRKEILGENHPDYAKSLNNLAFLYLSMGDYTKSEPLYQESTKILKEVLGENHPDYAKSLHNLALLYYTEGDYTKSEPLYQETMKIRKEVLGENHPDYAKSLLDMALLYASTGNYIKAEPLIVEANKNYINQISSYFPVLSETGKEKLLKTIGNKFDIFYSFGLDYYRDNLSIASEIFNLRLSIKGAILSSINRIKETINKSGDIELISLSDKLVMTKKSLYNASLLSLEEQSKRGIDFSVLETEVNNLEKELSRKSDSYKNMLEEKNVDYEKIKKILENNEAAIEFLDFRYYDKHWTDTTYYIALITRPGIENPILVKLCRLDELQKVLTTDADNKNSYARNSQTSNELYNLIWKPLEEHLQGTEKIYISPSGLLNKVSFASLNTDGKNLLIDKFRIRYTGNLRDIVRIKGEEEGRISGNNTAVLFGGIKYDIDETTMIENASKFRSDDEGEFKPSGIIVTSTAKTTGKWGYLEGTRTEVTKIKNVLLNNKFEITEFTEEFGTKEAFKSLSGDNAPVVLHISTHGYFNPEPEKDYKLPELSQNKSVYKMSDNPLIRSGLILAGANRVWTGGSEIEGVENGILTAYEVSLMDLNNTELIVLSACETGLGDIKGGEGVYGLQRSFRAAGAKNIIMSLWKVPDEATVELMEIFYKNWLEKKMTKEDAFNDAQRELRLKYNEPYYWAAFILM